MVKDIGDWLAGEHGRLAVGGQFGTRRYIAADVDAFVGEMVNLLEEGQLPESSLVHQVQFRTTTQLRGGYPMPAVDELLAELQDRLLGTRIGTDLTPEAAAMIAWIERARFRTTWRGGYDFREVGEFVARVRGELLNGRLPSSVPTFSTRRRGYDKRDVDAFVDEFRRGRG